MEGASLAAERRRDENTTLAYQAAMFRGASQSKKGVKPLAHYLIEKPRRREQSTSEMLDILQELKARGAPMNIRRVN